MAERKTILVLRLEGPLQSWGENAKWDFRDSSTMPTKSGIVGLLGCAMGEERGSQVLLELAKSITVAVRADRPGVKTVDFHSVTGFPLRNAERKQRTDGKGKPSDTFTTQREYLEDACFTVFIDTTPEWQQCCMDEEKHMQVVRKMYDLRFPGIDTSGMTLQQVRGMEGIRVRKTYELFGKTTGVKWKKRTYKTESWEASDAINRALSEANAMLYGVCHAAIVSMGFSPGLGFIHTGKQLSFVYDIADLYKSETTIPAAFEAVAKGGDVHKELRSLCRKYFGTARLMERIPRDLAELFDGMEGGVKLTPRTWG